MILENALKMADYNKIYVGTSLYGSSDKVFGVIAAPMQDTEKFISEVKRKDSANLKNTQDEYSDNGASFEVLVIFEKRYEWMYVIQGVNPN